MHRQRGSGNWRSEARAPPRPAAGPGLVERIADPGRPRWCSTPPPSHLAQNVSAMPNRRPTRCSFRPGGNSWQSRPGRQNHYFETMVGQVLSAPRWKRSSYIRRSRTTKASASRAWPRRRPVSSARAPRTSAYSSYIRIKHYGSPRPAGSDQHSTSAAYRRACASSNRPAPDASRSRR